MEPSEELWCAATINHVYDLRDCHETVAMRGPTKAVHAFSQMLIALRGVRHGSVHSVPLDVDRRKLDHSHGHSGQHVPFVLCAAIADKKKERAGLH